MVAGAWPLPFAAAHYWAAGGRLGVPGTASDQEPAMFLAYDLTVGRAQRPEAVIRRSQLVHAHTARVMPERSGGATMTQPDASEVVRHATAIWTRAQATARRAT